MVGPYTFTHRDINNLLRQDKTQSELPALSQSQCLFLINLCVTYDKTVQPEN